jgi:ABC-type sugar transport system, periplasmic component
MKKVLIVLLSLLFVFSLAACGKGDDTEGNDFMIAYIAKESRSSFHAILNSKAEEILDGMVSDGSIGSWRFYDGLEDPLVQVDLLENAINDGADLVVLLPAEEEGSAPVVSKCSELDIPCIVINSKTSNTDELATAYVTSNDVEAGEMMAEFVRSQFPEGGKYCHVQGVIGNSAQVQRGEGVHNIMDADENWTILDEQSGNWDPSKGVQFAEDWLNLFGDEINAIICDDDDTSSAIQNAVNAAGRTDIICIGVNGGATACTMIQAGTMLCTVYQDGAGQMIKGLEIAKAIATGADYTGGTVIVPYAYIDKSNVDQYI